MSLNGEAFGTITAPYSSISFTIGVVSASVDFDLFVYDAPTTPRPISIVRSALPFSLTVRARPTVPPAPSRLKTSVPAGDLVVLHDLGRRARGDVVAAPGGVGDHDPQVGQWLARVGGVRGLAGDAAAGGEKGEGEAENACGDPEHPGAGDR